MMEQKFQNFIDTNNLCLPTARILLGLSGGIDSVCMFHIFRQLNFPIGIAHCNFQLRGEESDADELFVKDLADEFDIPIFCKKFDTKDIAESEGISIQMAARDLRYEWFEEIRNKYEYNYIAIAHNSNDVVETFLINLTRGSGIKGFTGIKPKSGKIIRPLLFASRDEIKDYINENEFSYHEDSSNNSVKSSRNLIRHEIIPLFEKINPKFKDTVIENISRLKETEEIYFNHIDFIKNNVLSEKDNRTLIDLEKVKSLYPLQSILFELINPFGFSKSQVKDIIKSFDGIPGKQFYSTTHRVIRDRENLIIEELTLKQQKDYYIDADTEHTEIPLNLAISKFELDEGFEITKSNKIGYFDFDKLEFPLILRKWKKGDYFMPLGMKNLKKLSDFFIDNKLSLSDKENIWLLESYNKIIWIVGQRIDERFKITEKTRMVLKIEIL